MNAKKLILGYCPSRPDAGFWRSITFSRMCALSDVPAHAWRELCDHANLTDQSATVLGRKDYVGTYYWRRAVLAVERAVDVLVLSPATWWLLSGETVEPYTAFPSAMAGNRLVTCVPHPSGRNRGLNDDGARRRLGAALSHWIHN